MKKFALAVSLGVFVTGRASGDGAEKETSWFWTKILKFFDWYRDLVKSIGEWFDGFFVWLGDWIAYFYDYLEWAPRNLWNTILETVTDWFADIPVPDFISSIGSYTSTIPCEVWGMVAWAQLPAGIGIIIGALILRFLVRRLPFIG